MKFIPHWKTGLRQKGKAKQCPCVRKKDGFFVAALGSGGLHDFASRLGHGSFGLGILSIPDLFGRQSNCNHGRVPFNSWACWCWSGRGDTNGRGTLTVTGETAYLQAGSRTCSRGANGWRFTSTV